MPEPQKTRDEVWRQVTEEAANKARESKNGDVVGPLIDIAVDARSELESSRAELGSVDSPELYAEWDAQKQKVSGLGTYRQWLEREAEELRAELAEVKEGLETARSLWKRENERFTRADMARLKLQDELSLLRERAEKENPEVNWREAHAWGWARGYARGYGHADQTEEQSLAAFLKQEEPHP
jgi:hypothetical protein